jgi:hypothetical protein
MNNVSRNWERRHRQQDHGVLARRAGGRSPHWPSDEERRRRSPWPRGPARAGGARAVASGARVSAAAGRRSHTVSKLLILLAGAGLVAATAALWVQKRRWIDQRVFAGLVSTSVASSLFSIIAWAATEIAGLAPRIPTDVCVGTLALLFGLRLYRELQLPPSIKPAATAGN